MKLKISRKKTIVFIITGIVIVATVILAVVLFETLTDPYRGTNYNPDDSMATDSILTKEQVQDDMAYVMEMLRGRHPAWLEDDNEHVSNVEAQYLKELELLDSMQSDEITVLAEWQMTARILHELYDGHSKVTASYSEELYIDDYSQLTEMGIPVRIGNLTYAEAFEKFCAVFQYETESYAGYYFQNYAIKTEKYLKLMGFDTSDGIDMTFDTAEGEKNFHYDFVPLSSVKGYEDETSGESFVSYEIDSENGIGIFTLTLCYYNDEYKKAVNDFFTAVNEADIRHIVVDLRGNSGGNSGVATEFLKYVDVEGYYMWASHIRRGNFLIKGDREYLKNEKLGPQYSGDIYVLTNTRTYSAAMDFAMLIMDNEIGTVVGEASGNLPDSYGDILKFQLPNSGLVLSVSYKRWFRIDESKAGEPLTPDIECASDEAMSKAYEAILAGQ